MKLLVPTNWDPDLILPLSRLEGEVQIYGVLPTSMIGSGGRGAEDVHMVEIKQKNTSNVLILQA